MSISIAGNVQGLPQAADLDDTSGRAAQQIYFYLSARPTRCRLAASHVLCDAFFDVLELLF